MGRGLQQRDVARHDWRQRDGTGTQPPTQREPATAEEQAPAPEREPRTRSGGLRSLKVERWALLIAWAAVVLLFSLLKSGTYPTTGNFQTIFGSQAVLLVLTLGLILPLTTGDFDLSIASNMSFTAMLIAVLNTQHGWAIIPACIAGLLAAIVVGVINGGLVVLIGIDSFIVTLGTGTVMLGFVQWISNANDVTGASQHLITWTIGHRIGGISLIFYYGVIATLLLFYIFEFTPLGKRLLFVGRGRSVARLSGLHVTRIRLGLVHLLRLVRRPGRDHVRGQPGRCGPGVGPDVPAAGVRRRVPGRHGDLPRPLQPDRDVHRGVLPGLGNHRTPVARGPELRAAAVLRRRAGDRGRAVDARAAAGGSSV